MESRALVIITGVVLASSLAVRIARRIALKKALLDHPNERSSHKQPVPRLGGAAFIPVVLVAVGVGWFGTGLPGMVSLAFFGGCAALFGVSLVDDFRPLPAGTRFAVQFLAAGCFLSATFATQPLPFAGTLGTLVTVALVLGIVGLLNVYNFLDGIDGIAGLQAAVGGIAWSIIARELGTPAAAVLGSVLAAGALGFLTLNWPPAKIFMGDAGSTVIGFCFGVMPLLVWVETRGAADLGRLLIAAGLIVWPFLADGTFTIFRRLRHRENIFKAHRSHLYQRLVIAGRSHQTVTLVYGLLAAIGGVLAWLVVRAVPYASPVSVVVVLVAFLALWIWVVRVERIERLRRNA